MNRRWLAFGAAILAIAVFGTAGAVSDQKSSIKDKPQKQSSSDGKRGHGFGHLKDKRGGSKGKGFNRSSALGSLMSDEKARASIGAAIAETLGMTTDQIGAALKNDDKDIKDLMDAKGITEEKLGAAVAAAAKPHLDRLVKAGTIERVAADELLQHMAKGAWMGKLAHLSGIAGG